MGASNNAGDEIARGPLFCDLNLCGRSASYVCNWLSYTKPYAFYELVKAITKGNRTLEGEILRCWGIRRYELEAALSCGGLRPSDVQSWSDTEGCSDTSDSDELLYDVRDRSKDVELWRD